MADKKSYAVNVVLAESLDVSVANAIKELPKGARNITVVVYTEGLCEIEGASIHSLPVRFAQPTEDKPEGSVDLTYGWEDLEVASSYSNFLVFGR